MARGGARVVSHMTGPFYVEETAAFRWVVRSRTATFYRSGNQSNEARYLASHILTREDAEFICDAVNAQEAFEDERVSNGNVFAEGVRG